MPADHPTGFPPGEIGARFNQVHDLRPGEFVYVRMQVFRLETIEVDGVQCKLLRRAETAAFGAAWSMLMVPRSQIVCREPRAMEADGGLVRPVADI